MSLFASPGFSARDAQAGENRGVIAAHKYAGLVSCQRAIPRKRKTCGGAAACEKLITRGISSAGAIGAKVI